MDLASATTLDRSARSPAAAFPVRRTARALLPAALWALALLAMYAAALRSGYEQRDADSAVYERLAASLEARPFAEWVAPAWWAGRPKQGPFVEHLATYLWPAALLGRLGLARGALAANFLWTGALLYAIARLARARGAGTGALAALSYAVTPIAIQSLARSNHEPAWALGVVGAVWCAAEGRILGTALFVLLAFSIKGALGLLAFPVVLLCAPTRPTVAGLALGAALIAGFSLLYELWFRQATGQPFFAQYLASQCQGTLEAERLGVLHKLVNPVYYLANAAWFAFPGSALLLWRRGEKLSLRGIATIVFLVSLMSRRAVRYIFPVFALAQVNGARHALLERHARWGLPVLLATLTALRFAAR